MWQTIKNIYHLFVALGANIYYGFPGRELTVIGITGTSGKTTTTHMVYEVLKTAGYKVSLLSTIKAVIGGKEYDTGFHVTTPDPQTLPKYLRQAVTAGDKYFVLEVSSHALDQHRAAFVPFKIGVLTTLAHEHLDYHKTMENYAKAKFKLLHQAKIAVLPTTEFADNIKKAVRFEKLGQKVKTFGLDKGDYTQKGWDIDLNMKGNFNLLNGLAASAVGDLLGIKKQTIKHALATFRTIPGRYEEVQVDTPYKIVIDFAHKPDALEGLLQSARKEVGKHGKVIVMYGCASERDVLKRPMMGAISGRLADVTVLTDEDPRFESPMKIINEIAAGCIKAGAKALATPKTPSATTKDHHFYKIPDRQEAITFILTRIAKKGDIVLLCGKGHEQSMSYRGVEKPWSEHNAVLAALHQKKA